MMGRRPLRAWLGVLLALAMIAGGIGASFARGAAAGGSGTIIDSVLGAIPICHQTAGDTSGDGGQPAPNAGDHCPLCLLLTGIGLLALALLGILAAPLATGPSRRLLPAVPGLADDWPPGGLGSRAPPLLLA